MTGFGVAAILFALIFLGLMVKALASPGSGQSGASSSGRDGRGRPISALIVPPHPADDPPGPTLAAESRTRT